MQYALLFPSAVSIVRLIKEDANKRTDHLGTLRDLLLANEPMYPAIDRWVSRKVVPGLRSGERVAYVAYESERPVAAAVVKPGKRAKFCHLRINEELRDGGLGELFFTLMTLDVHATAEEIHFTLPESLWEERAPFFQSFGFAERVEAGTQYRLFERELRCSAPFAAVWQAVQGKLPRVASRLAGLESALGDAVLLSLKPQWAEAILQGRKRVELRRSFSRRWVHGRAFLYAGVPVQRIVGEARIAAVKEGRPALIWELFGAALGCSKEAFEAYTRGAEQVYAIELEDARAYAPALSLKDLRTMVRDPLRPPMSYARLASSPGWSSAVSLAALAGASLWTRALPGLGALLAGGSESRAPLEALAGA